MSIDKLAAAIALVQQGTVTLEHVKTIFSPVTDGDIRLVKRERGAFIAHVGQPVERVSILLCGSCYVFNYSSDGRSVMTGSCTAPQTFGLFELIRRREHTATVEALTTCMLLEISRGRYLQGICDSQEVTRYSLMQLAGFIDRVLTRNDRMMLNTPEQNLLIYLYEACGFAQLPVRLSVEKSLLAQELNMNLRTLYRKLETLKARGLIGGDKGKITINEAQYKEIRAQIGALLP